MTIKNNIAIMKRCLNDLEREVKVTSDLGDINDLVEACLALDEHYKVYFCAVNDEEEGFSQGTTYNSETGEYVEYYIEADMWHRISNIIRKMKRDTE